MLVVIILSVVLTGSCSSPRGAGRASVTVSQLRADAAAGRILPGSPVRVTGSVTDDDPERQLAFVADDSGAVAVHTTRAGLGVPVGSPVTVEGRVTARPRPPRSPIPVIVESTPATLAVAQPADAAEMLTGPFDGRRVELAAIAQTAALKDGRLALTVTSRGVQLPVEIRHPESTWRSVVGAQITIRGVAVPADRPRGLPARIVVDTVADLHPRGGSREAVDVTAADIHLGRRDPRAATRTGIHRASGEAVRALDGL